MVSSLEILENILQNLARSEKIPPQWATTKLEPDLVISDLDIDSLGMSILTLELEDATNVQLPDDALIRFGRIGELVKYIDEAREKSGG